jgi:hypothetical protein
MDDKDWEDVACFDEEIDDQDKKSKSKMRKRKWREIENIKEQRRLRRDIDSFEQYSY